LLTSRFFRRLFLPYLLLICLAIGLVGAFAARRMHDVYLQDIRHELGNEAILVEDLVGLDVSSGADARVEAHARLLGARLGCRITIVDEGGRILGDSEADPRRMENHRDRPEIMRASVAGQGDSIRPSATLNRDLLYLARKAAAPGGGTYYIRLARHLSDLDRQLGLLYSALGVVCIATIAMAAGLAYIFASRHTAPVRELADFAHALTRGDMHRRLLPGGQGEIATLTTSLNAMADSITTLLDQAGKDRAELLAILTSMSDGVIATDTRQRVVLVNQVAAALLGFDAEGAQGKRLFELVRNEPVLRAAAEVLADGGRRTFQVSPSAGRYLDVSACTFPADGEPAGLVLVAHDTTRSVRYQELRKEFVANVSHELRTPLTVIKGFTETLMDGALQDPVAGPKFLGTIRKHVDQLTNLVSDLLELSRLEGSPELPRPVRIDLGALVRRVVDLLQPTAQKKSHTIALAVGPELPCMLGNPDYLERAISNLIDNAIKYTPEGGTIRVAARQEADRAVIEVQDNGIGIPADDIPRIFERFYRVDRSRSREMGGTGLGLSIVKHVVQVHGGSIEVTSTPGAGSCFRLRIPLPDEHLDLPEVGAA
jgi:two-component system phosphate regulon sensor histidine kinase PhoR